MRKKYKLTHKKKEVLGHTIHQIKALKDFGNVNKGDLGGWIENPSNLSQNGNAWVYGNAQVYDNAIVSGNAMVYDNATVSGDAKVCNKALLYGNANVYDNAWVYDNAIIYDHAQVCGNAHVYGNAQVSGYSNIYDYAQVYGGSKIKYPINIHENDVIDNDGSYLVFKNTWSSGRSFIYVLSNHRWHVGCFNGTSEELIKKAYHDSELSGKMYELYVHFAEQVVKTQQRNKGLNNVQ